jgi:acyl dehydratase
MSINLSAVGKRSEPFVRTWDYRDAMLYAISVGAGQRDPSDELQFTTENTAGLPQQVIPTFAVPVVQNGLGKLLTYGDYPRGALVHAEQSLTLHRPLPVTGSVTVTAGVVSIADKGSGALVHLETRAVDTATAEPIVSTRMGYFIRGEGGFGGHHGYLEAEPWTDPTRDADESFVVTTRPDQALLYRLNGDYNPLHSDPAAATAAGFPRPILHGLATYGIAARVLLNGLLGADPARLSSITARFTRPVFPGETLVINVWREDGGALFRLSNGAGASVLDRGRLVGDLADGLRDETANDANKGLGLGVNHG